MHPPSGQCQPVLYRWDDRSLSFSENQTLAAHHHGAAELIIAFDEPFESLLLDGQKVCTRSLLIPASTQHQNIHQDLICPILYLDPEGRDYQLLTVNLDKQARFYSDLSFEVRARRIFKKIYRELPSAQAAYELIQEALFGSQRPTRKPLDPRIQKVLDAVHADYAKNHSIEYLASVVHLSEDRLLHLFSEQIGMPFRKYRSWVRLKQASKLVFEGNDLTQAARATGFSDSSHYTKTFTKLFGTQPSKLLSRRRNLNLIFG